MALEVPHIVGWTVPGLLKGGGKALGELEEGGSLLPQEKEGLEHSTRPVSSSHLFPSF